MPTAADRIHIPAVPPSPTVPAGLHDDDADREWRDFLATALPASPALLGAAGPWRHAPVLLSY